MAIDELAFELYGLAPEDFTAARNARVKELKGTGDRGLAAAVHGLHKPTAGAWLLNQLVRRHRAEVEQVLDLGIRLRAAQGTLAAADLRALDVQRRELTRAVAGTAVAIGRDAGRAVSAQVFSLVEESLRSAMVDPDAGRALATGLLIDTFSSTGLEPVDVSRVVALSGIAVGRRSVTEKPTATASEETVRSTQQHAAAITGAQRALDDANQALEAARRVSDEARRLAVRARRRREDLQSELDEGRRHLEDLEKRVLAATESEGAATRAQVTATRDERSAIGSAEQARGRLDTLLSDRAGEGA